MLSKITIIANRGLWKHSGPRPASHHAVTHPTEKSCRAPLAGAGIPGHRSRALMPFFRPAFLLPALAVLAGSAMAVDFNDATLALLKSTNRNDRARVYATMGHLTPEETTAGVAQLRMAWDFHKA